MFQQYKIKMQNRQITKNSQVQVKKTSKGVYIRMRGCEYFSISEAEQSKIIAFYVH